MSSNAITSKTINSFKKNQEQNYAAAQRAVTINGIYAASENNALSATNSTVFSYELESGSVTDQQDSGRCWLFSALNVLRHQIEKKLGIDSFELSQSYLYFYDKLEKSNSFYEQVIATAHDPLDDRLVTRMFYSPQADGGWWEYAASLITKYGIVPKSAMPEAATTTNSRQLNILLDRILRKGALQLRRLVAEGKPEEELQAVKQTLLADVYRFLTISIGTPPTSFEFSYRDKNKKFHRIGPIAPLEFLREYSAIDLAQYISVINDPSPSKRYQQLYTFSHEGNVVGGRRPLFLNVDIETLKDLTLKQLQTGEAVWFGCDVMQDTNKKGFMALDVYDFEGTFGIDMSLTKAERLASHETSVSHAMTITGVDIVKDKPVQWKVENSWGENRGLKGYYTMSNGWFDEHAFVSVIRRDILPEALQEALKGTPEVLPPWDPLNGMLPD